MSTRALARCTNGKQPISPLGKLEMSCWDKMGEESKQDRSQIGGAVLPKSGRLATMIYAYQGGRRTDRWTEEPLPSPITLNSKLC